MTFDELNAVDSRSGEFKTAHIQKIDGARASRGHRERPGLRGRRRKDYAVALNISQSGPDPDPILDALYRCGSSLNLNGYCNPEVDKLIEQQSIEADQGKRKQLVWAIERKLAEDGARPVIFYDRRATCWNPHVKGLTLLVNSLFNGWRMEDIWLDK